MVPHPLSPFLISAAAVVGSSVMLITKLFLGLLQRTGKGREGKGRKGKERGGEERRGKGERFRQSPEELDILCPWCKLQHMGNRS